MQVCRARDHDYTYSNYFDSIGCSVLVDGSFTESTNCDSSPSTSLLVPDNRSLCEHTHYWDEWISGTIRTNGPPVVANTFDAEEIFVISNELGIDGAISCQQPFTSLQISNQQIAQRMLGQPVKRKPRAILPKPEKNFNSQCAAERWNFERMLSRKANARNDKNPSAKEMNFALKCISDLQDRLAITQDKTNRCKLCDKVFCNKFNLIVHYRSHAGMKPYVCVICMNSFTRRHSLKVHMMCHSEEMNYVCPFCNRGFRNTAHFRDHILRHRKDPALMCRICRKGFANSYSLRRHVGSKHNKAKTVKDSKLLLQAEEQHLQRKALPNASLTQISQILASPLNIEDFRVKVGLPRNNRFT